LLLGFFGGCLTVGAHEKKRAKKRQQKQRELLKNMFGDVKNG
jgi:hypothetical protein